MSIETNCPGCGRKLRVAAEFAGQTARCPLCNTVYTVPSDGATAELEPGEKWHLKTPEGQTYGPVRREQLDQWVSEGRVSDDCQLLNQAAGVWQSAVDVYPILRPVTRKIPPAQPLEQTGPLAPLTDSSGAARILNPHRGGIVLALGVISWAVGCPILGVMAWVMGSQDLRDMQQGIMDDSGRGLTQAGQIIGMIHVILSLISIVLGLFAFFAMVVWR